MKKIKKTATKKKKNALKKKSRVTKKRISPLLKKKSRVVKKHSARPLKKKQLVEPKNSFSNLKSLITRGTGIKETSQNSKSQMSMGDVKSQIENKFSGNLSEYQQQILEQRSVIDHKKIKGKDSKKSNRGIKEVPHMLTGIPGLDELFEKGIPKGSSVLVAGGAGSGKTIMCLQIAYYHAQRGEKCLYMSFEEPEEKLIAHMESFGWDAQKEIKSGKLKIKRESPFTITRNVDALLAKEKGELLIDLDPLIIPKGFKPSIVIIDSLTAIGSAFTGKEDSYRIYIEQLFRFLEKIGGTSFLITETEQIPKIFSTTGVEEFLADGVMVLYNLKKGDVRENALEILKMRGEKHQKKIVAMQITENGIRVFPDQEVFSEIE